MKTASSFFTLTAADLMSREVITLREDDPLDRAAKLFAKEQIGGAPVVDCEGCCVGVLSLADLGAGPSKREALRSSAPRQNPGLAHFRPPIATAMGRK